MVVILRVDDRLLHGQVAFSWLNLLGPDAIVIANDEVMTNEIQKTAIKMAKPTGVKMSIRSLKGGIDLINDERVRDLKLFVVVKTTEDALALINSIHEHISLVNIGGLSNRTKGNNKIVKGVYLSDQDISNVKEIMKKVDKVDVRIVPTDPNKNIATLI